MKARQIAVRRGSMGERALLAKAVLILPSIWLALRIFRFATIEGAVSRLSNRRRQAPPGTARQVIDAVQAAARHVPGASCLPQAIALKLLMSRRGLAAEIRIGVARSAHGALVAHAWVEGEGWTAPCGDTSLDAYARLTGRRMFGRSPGGR